MQFITTKEACKFLKTTRQQIYNILIAKRVNFTKDKHRFKIDSDSLKKYSENRWKRSKYFNEDELGVKEASKYLGITAMQMYNLIYKGHVHYRRTGSLYIIKKQDLEPWKQAKRILSQLRSRQKQIDQIIGQKNIKERKKLKRLSSLYVEKQK